MLLPVAVVIDDPVDHVSRPIDVRLVSHYRNVVLTVLVALLVYLHRHSAAILDFADLVAAASDDEFNLFGIDLERFRLGRGRVDPRGPTWGTATVAESTATAAAPTATGAVPTAASVPAAVSTAASSGAVATAAAAATTAVTAAAATVVTALPIVPGASATVSTVRIVTFSPVWHDVAYVELGCAAQQSLKVFTLFTAFCHWKLFVNCLFSPTTRTFPVEA